VPVIGLRLVAVHGVLRGQANDNLFPQGVPDAELPTYTILAPLYREAHMLQSLVQALRRLDWPALGSKGTK
jgi:cellulose synthase/poly-beta-1,6-N-acetylglucosamine synthase-like glycosyltransferase